MSEAIFLGLDCETGGIGSGVSLLTAHFAVCDKDLNILDELHIFLKPKEVEETGSAVYRVTAAALEINKINIIEHDKIAVTSAIAGQQLREFLWKYKPTKGWLMPVGKNVGGDIDWVNEHILGAKEWGKTVSYRTYDITTMITYLKRKGKLAADFPESLEGAAKYIGFDFVPHTADGDNRAGIAVVKWLESL